MVRKSSCADEAPTVSEIEPDAEVSTMVEPHRSDETEPSG